MATCYRHPNRETGLSCTECERPICTDCLRMTPVGPRCPEHASSGRPALRAPAGVRAKRRLSSTTRAAATPVTIGLIAVNVVVYLVTVAQGAGIDNPGGSLFAKWVLATQPVAGGDWWRLLTAEFLHANLLHIGMNMLVLYMVGAAVEAYMGSRRFLALYLVAAIAGSAGALLTMGPGDFTVGASGAVFGIFGALLIIEHQQTGSFAGQAMTLIVINLALTFAVPNISYGAHIGGLVGGALGAFALARFGRGHVAYGRAGIVGYAGLVAVAALSVAVAYWKTRGYA